MSPKKLRIYLLVIFIALFLIFLIFAILKILNSEFDFITYIAGISSFFIALLTVLYVLTSSKQFEIMSNQLKEMEQERKLQERPLPYLGNIRMEIERPKFYFVPPTKEYSFQSRYFVKSGIGNLSISPAVCTDIIVELQINRDSSLKNLQTSTKRLNILPGNKKTEEKDFSVMFCGDDEAFLFDAIREEKAVDYPKIKIIIVYKSISGGYFLQTNYYYIAPYSETENKLIEWHTHIVQFKTRYKSELKTLLELYPDRDKWHNLFEEVQKKALGEIPKDKTIRLDCNSDIR